MICQARCAKMTSRTPSGNSILYNIGGGGGGGGGERVEMKSKLNGLQYNTI